MLLEYSNLTDEKKIIVELFSSDGNKNLKNTSVLLLWTYIFNLKNNISLRNEVCYVFANAAMLLDTLALVRQVKREFLSGRPVTTIRKYLENENILTWYPYAGTVETTGNKFIPYQSLDFVTPKHSENSAGHYTLYTVTAYLFERLYGTIDFYDPNFEFEFNNSEWIYSSLAGQNKFIFGQFVTPAKSSFIEPGLTPQNPIVLTWNTIYDWANQCGISRLYGGVHWDSTIKASEKQGFDIAINVYKKLIEKNIL